MARLIGFSLDDVRGAIRVNIEGERGSHRGKDHGKLEHRVSRREARSARGGALALGVVIELDGRRLAEDA